MKTVSKALIGTVAAGAMAVSAATPAFAEHPDRDRGISAGDVIAGAVILGGIAAVAGAIGKDRGYYDDRNYRYRDRRYGDRWNRRGNPRRAVERCVRAAEREARRYGYRYADVTQIRDVDDTRYGWRVKGRIEVQGNHGYRDRYRNYDRRYRYRDYDRRYRDYDRGYRYRGSDRGKFTCYVGPRQRPQVDFSGIRGLH